MTNYAENQGSSAHDAELAVIGAILLNPAGLADVAELLGLDDFASLSCRNAYAALLRLKKAGKPIDYITVEAEVRAGGEELAPGFLEHAVNSCPGVNLKAHADLVRDSGARMRLQEAALDAHQMLGRPDVSIPDAVSRLAGAVDSYRDRFAPAEVAPGVEDYVRKVVAWQEGEEEGLVHIGYRALDSRGIVPAPGNVAIIAASRSKGKTMWALNIAAKMAGKGKPVLFCSLEMTATEIFGRLVAMKTRIPAWRVKRKGELTPDELAKVFSAMKTIKELPFYVDDSARSIPEVEAATLKAHALHGVRTLFVDYLQIMRLPKSDQASQRALLLGDAVADLKQLAKKVSGVAFVLSQVNAEGECKESRAIEEAADQIYLIDRDFDSPDMRLTVTKSRNSGVAECHFNVHLESGVVSDSE